jgi:MFS family permease
MSFTSAESRWSDVYLAAGARGISACGDFLAATALALALQSAGAGGLAVSGLLLAAALPLAVLAPITGRIADRVDSRTLLITAGLAQAGICVALAYAHGTVLIVALVALLACGLAVTQPTLAALLPAMVRREDLARAGGINQTASMVGILIAPALAGLLVGQFGARIPLLLDAVSYLALVAAGLLIRTRRAHAARPGPDATVSWRMRDDRLVFVMVGAIAAVVAGVGAINVIEVFFVRETLGASPTMFGLLGAAWTVGMLVGAALSGRYGGRVPDPARLVWLALLLAAVTCAVVLAAAGARHALLLVPLWLIGGAGNGGINVFTGVVLAERVPEAARGRAYAVMGAAVQGAGMIGYAVAGPLLERFEPRPLVAAAGLAGLAAVACCLPAVRRAGREIGPLPQVKDRHAPPAGDSVPA